MEETNENAQTPESSENAEQAEQTSGAEKAEEAAKDQPSPEISKDARMWAMLCHLLGLFTCFIGPLIVWLIKKEENPFIDKHGKEAFFCANYIYGIFAADTEVHRDIKAAIINTLNAF